MLHIASFYIKNFIRYLEENKLTTSYQRVPEENWDGCSLTFQGSNTQPLAYHPATNFQQPLGYATLPSSYRNQHGSYPNTSYSLPRGRGRLHQEYEPVIGGIARSITPDRGFRSPCNSRPPTPPPFSNVNKPPEIMSSRPETPVQVQKPDENYNARYLENPINEENNFVWEKSTRRGPFMHGKRQNEEQGNSYNKLNDETLTCVARALIEDKMPAKSLQEQLSPASPPTPTPEVNSKTNMVLVSKNHIYRCPPGSLE